MLNSSQRSANEYTQINSVPPQKPPAVISSSKTSENPLPAFNFDSRPSINWGGGKSHTLLLLYSVIVLSMHIITEYICSRQRTA